MDYGFLDPAESTRMAVAGPEAFSKNQSRRFPKAIRQRSFYGWYRKFT
jgi:hypothetical protein